MRRIIRNGFTLYELLITLLIVGMVLTLGIPNFTEFTRNSRMTATANDLHSALQLARSEAARLLVTTPLGRTRVVRDRAIINDALVDMQQSCP
jgi:prepilin-type N-terminal cleavage/methylation domain-containing protein